MVLPEPPYARYEKESATHYYAFVQYRNMPVMKRSVRVLSSSLDYSQSQLTIISSRYRWVERAAAWDMHVAELTDQLSETATLAMRGRQAILGKAAQKLALDAIVGRDATKVGPVTALKLAREGADLEREALGLPVGKQPIIVQPNTNVTNIGLALPAGENAASHPFQPRWLQPKPLELEAGTVEGAACPPKAEKGTGGQPTGISLVEKVARDSESKGDPL